MRCDNAEQLGKGAAIRGKPYGRGARPSQVPANGLGCRFNPNTNIRPAAESRKVVQHACKGSQAEIGIGSTLSLLEFPSRAS
jgi:hypothetical protein